MGPGDARCGRMRDQDSTIRHVVDQLLPLGPVVARPMYGATTLSLDDRVFAIVHDGTVYFKTAPTTLSRYLLAGSAPFHLPKSTGIDAVMSYYAVPDVVLSDSDLACAWAYEAVILCDD